MLHMETPGQPEAGETGAGFLFSLHVSGLCKDPESLLGAQCAAAGPLCDSSAVFWIYFMVQKCHGWWFQVGRDSTYKIKRATIVLLRVFSKSVKLRLHTRLNNVIKFFNYPSKILDRTFSHSPLWLKALPYSSSTPPKLCSFSFRQWLE